MSLSGKRTKLLVDSWVQSMTESIRLYSNGRLSEAEIKYLAEYTVSRLDFENEEQMSKGIHYFAEIAVDDFILRSNCMASSKKSNSSELVEEMKRFSENIQNMKKEEAIQFLIQIGVLDSEGMPKEQICGNSNYMGMII